MARRACPGCEVDSPDMLIKILLIIALDVDTVDKYFALVRVVQAH